MRNFALLIAAALATTTAPAFSDVIAPDGRVIECYCTDAFGQRRELGDIICITVDSRSYMAKCVMAQNVPFWRDQNRGCLSSKKHTPQTPFPKVAILDDKNRICS